MLTGWRNGWINYLYRFSRNSAFWKKNGFHAYNSPCDFILNCTEPFFEKIHFLVFCCSAAAAAAKLLQSCPTLCDPIDGSPPGSAVPGILQARTLEWVAISFSSAWKWKVKVKLLSCIRLFATPWTAAYHVPLSMGFSRQEYWSGVPLPSPTHTLLLLLLRCFSRVRLCATP